MINRRSDLTCAKLTRNKLSICWARWEKIELELRAIEEKHKRILDERQKLRVIMLTELQPDPSLTRREAEVMSQIQKNPYASNKELAQILFVVERTVKFHVASLLRKFNVESKRQLIDSLPREIVQ